MWISIWAIERRQVTETTGKSDLQISSLDNPIVYLLQSQAAISGMMTVRHSEISSLWLYGINCTGNHIVECFTFDHHIPPFTCFLPHTICLIHCRIRHIQLNKFLIEYIEAYIQAYSLARLGVAYLLRVYLGTKIHVAWESMIKCNWKHTCE